MKNRNELILPLVQIALNFACGGILLRDWELTKRKFKGVLAAGWFILGILRIILLLQENGAEDEA